MPVKNRMQFWTLMLGIIALSIIIQSLLFLNWDVASLLYATRVMLAGGKYATDLFIPNPPTILYLYVPPLVLSDMLQINIVVVFKAYIYLLAALSVYMSDGLVRVYFKDGRRYAADLFMLALMFSYLVLPTYEFGNRDYLMLLLVMPYILMTASRLHGMSISTKRAICIGLFAGIGFAIKPHFVVTLGLIELYYLYCQRKWLSFVRPETLAIAGVLLLYTIILFTVHANYIYVMLPFLINNYYAAISTSLITITIYPLTVFCFMSMLLCLLIRPDNQQQALFNVLTVALCGFIASIYMQHTLFYYHFLPAITVSLLLVVMQAANLVNHEMKRNDMVKLGLLVAVFIAFDIHYYHNSWRYLVYYPWYFYAVFAGIFAGLTYAAYNNIISVLSRVMFIIMAGVLCSTWLLNSGHFDHRFLIVMCIMSTLYVLLLSNASRQLFRQTLITALLVAMLYVPAMQEIDLYTGPREYKLGAFNKLVSFINSRGGKPSIYVFSPAIYYAFPLVFYSNAVPAQRFEQMWPIMGFVHPPKFHNQLQADAYRKNKDYFISIVVEDFKKNKPDLIFIDTMNTAKSTFDYIAFFSANPEFVEEWKSYQYLTTLHLGVLNNREADMPVYQRIR